MILLCGIPSERPIDSIWRQATAQGRPVIMWDQRNFLQTQLELHIHDESLDGTLWIGEQSYALSEMTGVFLRTLSETQLPELADAPPDSSDYRYCVDLHARLYAWCESAPCVVMNPVSAVGSNGSKPYQAAIIREFGFSIPETIISNDPREVRDFKDRHTQVVYKSISGTRSIVQPLTEADFERLDAIRWCPTQFQAYVSGRDIRVHVVGSQIFASEIETNSLDYRYAGRDPEGWTKIQPTSLTDEVAENCLRLTRALGLELSGIDLRRAPDGRMYCFEVNPCPGFTYYESHTGQPIAQAIARCLGNGPADV